MSLVNQVLKDLQQRRSEHPDTSGLGVAAAVTRPSGARRWTIVGAAAVALGLALFFTQRALAPAPEPEPEPEPRAAAVEAVPTTRVEAVAADPVEVPADDAPTAVLEPMAAADEAVVADAGAAEPLPEPTPEPEPAMVEPEAVRPAAAAEPPADEPAMSRTLVATTPRQRADAAYAAAVRELAAGRRGVAGAKLREALGHDPSMVDARLALADLLAAQGSSREAEALLSQGLRLAPGTTPLAERHARLLLERGDLAGAIGALLAAAPPVAADAEYHAFLAALLQRAGNHAAAADTYAALVELRPDHGVWWMGLGISLEAGQRYAPALDAYRNAARDPRLSARVAEFVQERIAALSK